MNDRVGAAYVFYEVKNFVAEQSFRLPNYCTVFQAEIKAINEAAKRLTLDQNYKYVRFFIDSQAAILALESRIITSKLVSETIRSLNIASLGRNITLHWTKAHVGTLGNERADEGAKKGGLLPVPDDTRLPKAERKQRIESYFYNKWETEWANYHKARMTKLFYIKPDKNQAKYVLKLGRLEMSRFIKIITGHNGLFYFKHKVDSIINPICRFCLEADETFYHLATECPVHWAKRTEFFLDILPTTNSKWSVRALLDFSQAPGIREAIEGQTNLHLFGEDHNWDSSETSGVSE